MQNAQKNEKSMQKNERSRKINSNFNKLSGNIKELVNIQNIFVYFIAITILCANVRVLI